MMINVCHSVCKYTVGAGCDNTETVDANVTL